MMTPERAAELCALVDAEREAQKAADSKRDDQAELAEAEPQFGKWGQNVSTPPTPTKPGFLLI